MVTKSGKKASNWKVTTNRYVGYIDIMGFKDLVSRNTHAFIYKLMQKIENAKKLIEKMEWPGTKVDLITSTTYSDSIIIYSKDNTFKSLLSFSYAMSALSNELFKERLAHKGAVAFGTMTLDTKNSIFFGQPLIDAYLLQEELNFYGICLHASAQREIETKHSKSEIEVIRNCQCLLRNGLANHLVIFPLFGVYYSEAPLEIIAENKKLLTTIKNLRHNTSGHLRKYIEYTEKYLTTLQNEVNVSK